MELLIGTIGFAIAFIIAVCVRSFAIGWFWTDFAALFHLPAITQGQIWILALLSTLLFCPTVNTQKDK